MNTHEFEEKKVNGKCGDCHTKLSTGLLAAKCFVCRNCLAVLCKKCRGKPENATGCGSNLMNAAAKAAPTPSDDPVMEFYIKYVKRNANGEMVVRGLPPEWKQLFKDAGVKPKELQDPKTASWLIGLMNDILSGKITGDAGAAGGAPDEPAVLRVEALYDFAAVQEGDLSFRKGDIIIVKNVLENGWAEGEAHNLVGQFPYNYVKELPPEPRAAPPPPAPRPTLSPPQDHRHAPEPEPVHEPAAPMNTAPPPPPPAPVTGGPKPPPPPPPGGKPAPAAPAAPNAPHAPPPPPAAAAAPKAGSFLDDIASGGAAKLRKVADTPPPQKKELSQLTANERSNMLDIISAAMNARRKDIDDVQEEDGGDWDDWEDE